MPIRTIVTRGFSNGVFDSKFIPMRGFTPGTFRPIAGLLTFTGQNVILREVAPPAFLNFDYHRNTERKEIVSTPQSFINIQLSATKVHTYVLQLFNDPTDKFQISIGLDIASQDLSVITWFSNVPAGNVIARTFPLSQKQPETIQVTQSPTDIFKLCDIGALINLPPGPIFFNVKNRENRNTAYTMIIIESPCV